VRAVSIYPTKVLGTVVNHGALPVERIAVGDTPGKEPDNDTKHPADADLDDVQGPLDVGRWWMTSIGHDETLYLTDLAQFFSTLSLDGTASSDEDDSDSVEDLAQTGEQESSDSTVYELNDHPSPPLEMKRKASDVPTTRKRKKTNKPAVHIEPDFFDGL
jgi:WD repeat-containing protein 55